VADWIDVTLPVRTGMTHWPDDPPPRVERVLDLARGDACTLTHLDLSAHTGTHVDAPAHFVAGAATLDDLAADALVGPARVLAIADPHRVTATELGRARLRRGERVLLRTANSARGILHAPFAADYVALDLGAARLLAARGVRAVGIDALSIGAPGGEGEEVHRVLFAAGIWVVEGLDLAAAPAGRIDLVCLPLRLAGAEGAPARVMVRPPPPPPSSVEG
jgi:arylformamidase